MKAEDFWNSKYEKLPMQSLVALEPKDQHLAAAIAYFGDVRGKRILDMGFGDGTASIFFAQYGATVVSIDVSEAAVERLTQICISNNILNIHPILKSASEVNEIEPVDFVYGAMILHHLEPFDPFPSILSSVLKEDGKAFFWENNAQSSLLMWFRNNLVGKAWIPKNGDDEEHPLTKDEVNNLRQHFSVVQLFPDMYFFRLLAPYLFRGHFLKPLVYLDKMVYRFKPVRKYSYRQQLLLQKNGNSISC